MLWSIAKPDIAHEDGHFDRLGLRCLRDEV